MISDEPDEDADVDDETAQEIYFGDQAQKPNAGASPAAMVLPDWPPQLLSDIGLQVDSETLAWFRHQHADWRHQMRSVLRSWVAMKSAKPQKLQLPAPIADAETNEIGQSDDRA